MSIIVTRAKKLVLAAARKISLGVEDIALNERALGRVLSTTLRAPQPSPRWDVSAMDGFAVRSRDFPGAYTAGLRVLGTALAGSAPLRLKKTGAIRIMTGALIPSGADAVIPKELARETDGRVSVEFNAAVGL